MILGNKTVIASGGIFAAACALAYGIDSRDHGSPNTLAYYNPAFVNTINAYGRPFADYIPRAGAEIASAGDFVNDFRVPNGSKVRVLVKAPAPAQPWKILNVPRIKPGTAANGYFAGAIQEAMAGGYASVVFPKAVYRFAAPASSSDSHLLIKGASDLTIDGQGSTLDFASPVSAGVTISNSQRVVFRGFNVDWSSVLMASVGTIHSIDKASNPRTMTLQIRPQYPVDANTQIIALSPWDESTDPGNPHFALKNFQKEEYTENVRTVYLGNHTFQVPYYNNNINVGDVVLVRHFGWSPWKNAIQAGGCDDIDFEHVNVYASPYLAFYLSGGGGYRLSHCSVTRLNPARLISSSADAVHVADNTGDIIIEDSEFGYQGDDGLNIHGAVAGTVQPGENSFHWTATGESSYAPYGWQPNDTVGFFDGNFAFLGVTKFESLSHPKSGLQINLKDVAPKGAAEIADFSRVSARFVIRNNKYLYNRARGILLESTFGLVENNSFVGQTQHGIQINASPYSEGPGVQDVVFRGNRFSNVGSFPTTLPPPVSGPVYGALVATVQGRSANQESAVPIHEDLIFESNGFHDLQGPGLYLSSANNVVFAAERFEDTNLMRLQFTGVDSDRLDGSLITAQAHNVFFANPPSSP